jgi:hypothetical protein
MWRERVKLLAEPLTRPLAKLRMEAGSFPGIFFDVWVKDNNSKFSPFCDSFRRCILRTIGSEFRETPPPDNMWQ